MNKISDTVKHLLILNVIFFIGTMAIGGGESFYKWFTMYFPKNDAFQPWQIITHMFMHGGLMHLAFNMLALWMFGTPVEQRIGSKKFLFLYFSAGLGALMFQLGDYYFDYIPLLSNVSDAGLSSGFINSAINLDIIDVTNEGVGYFNREILFEKLPPLLSENNINSNLIDQKVFDDLFSMNMLVDNSRMVGASGCIMGILAAFGMMYPESKLMLIFLPIPIKAKYFIPGLILMDIILGFRGQSIFGFNIAHFAHVGGALTGFIIMWYWRKTQFNKNRWD